MNAYFVIDTPDVEFQFGNKSLWSNAGARKIKIDKIAVEITDEGDYQWAFLNVYFNEDSWNTAQDGLIYTDAQFSEDLDKFMLDKFGVKGIDYSEQGMQGDTFVNFDFDFKGAKKLETIVTAA